MVGQRSATWSASSARGGDPSRTALEPRAARALPRPHRAAERRRSTRSSRSTSTAPGPRPTRADDDAARGDGVGPLHGLPITIKDAIEVEGIRSTGGAIELTDHVPAADAPAVARLKDAGRDRVRQDQRAALVGRPPDLQRDLRHDEQPVGRRPRRRAARRAARPPRSPRGFTSFELGTDIGGSVRIPSHCCGVFGLKPSYGVVPQRGYLDHVGGGTTDADINVFGPIARSADDLDLPARRARRRPSPSAPSPGGSSCPRRDVAVARRTSASACGSTTRRARSTASTARMLAPRGRRARRRRRQGRGRAPAGRLRRAGDLFNQMIVRRDLAEPAPTTRSPRSRAGSHLAWLRARAGTGARSRRVWAEWFEQYDVLLCPVLAVAGVPARPGRRLLQPHDRGQRRAASASSAPSPGPGSSASSACRRRSRRSAAPPPGSRSACRSWRRTSATAGRFGPPGLVGEVTGGYEVPPGF